MTNISLLIGAPSGGEGSSPQGSTVQILMIAGVFAVFWFLIIRPQRKKQKDAKAMVATMKKGDKATSIGGIKGIIQNVKEDSVILKVDSNATLEFAKSAISSIESGSTEKVAPAKPAAKSVEKKKTNNKVDEK